MDPFIVPFEVTGEIDMYADDWLEARKLAKEELERFLWILSRDLNVKVGVKK